MKYIDGEKRDQMPRKGEFKDGEFILFVRSILDTFDLYHDCDVNPRAAVIVLKSLSENYQEPLEIVGLQRRANGIIISLKTSEFADRELLKEEYYSRYDLTLALEDPGRMLPQYEVLEARVTELVEDVKQRPTNQIKYLYNEGLVITGGSPNVNIDSREQIAFNLAAISEKVITTINQLPDSPNLKEPGIKELLKELEEAISNPSATRCANETNLDDEDKAEALEAVKDLAEAGKNPGDRAMKKIGKRATRLLTGMATTLPTATKFVEACNKLLPEIAKIFGPG